jgi:hypothetical protein
MAYAERVARHLGHDVVAACAVRPRGTITTTALCAGAGAAIGSLAGGTPIFAGIGGGSGVVIGYLFVWLRIRGSGLSLSMALVLAADRLELMRLGMTGFRPAGTIRSLPYSEIEGVEVEKKRFEIRIRIRAAGDEIVVDGGRRGVGAARNVVDELRRRIAA